MNAKQKILKEIKLRASRHRSGKDGSRKVIKQGGSEDIENFMSRHANDRMK